MINDNLFEEILVEPVKTGADKLYIVSGYATSAMAFHHLNKIREELNPKIRIELIVGMCVDDGLSLSNHRGFQKLVQEEFPKNFQCSYIMQPPRVHSKVYTWCKEDMPVRGYVGSANYTQTAFIGKSQLETIVDCDPSNALNYFQNLSSNTIYCTHPDAENFITIYHDKYESRLRRKRKKTAPAEKTEIDVSYETEGLPSVTTSLLDNKGKLPQRSGLNWGQRDKREPNQAYIKLSAGIYKSNFFPPKTVHFTVLTDDNKVLTCTRAQDNAKAIHTPHNNSLLGEYFRNRLNLPNGALVTIEDLEKYGRTDLTFYKIDDETFYMDFSVTD